MMQRETHVEFLDNGDALITVTTKHCNWWCKASTEVRQYRGSGGSWNCYPSGVSCSSNVALWMCGLVTAAEWEREDAEKSQKKRITKE